jgi:hypothetical protein
MPIPEHIRAANREAARRDAARAPNKLADWQLAIIAPLLGPRPRPRRRARDTDAA